MNLTKSQQSAIEFVTSYARNYKQEAMDVIDHVLKMSDVPRQRYLNAVEKLKRHSRIALHFHPDRPDPSMKPVAVALLEQGFYKSQFETLISNGSVSAHPGGHRDLWEKKLFGGAYQLEGTTNNQRPKYGALNVMNHPDGPTPRFGSCYFLLAPEVSNWATFTYLDSHQDPKEKGTYEEFDFIMSALLEELFTRETALGERDLTVVQFIDHLFKNLEKGCTLTGENMARRNLNHYIEAQVHRTVALQEDVEVLVADPSFKGTEIGKTLEQLCKKYSIELTWHTGFVLDVNEVPTNFRGPSMPSLAKRISEKCSIDAQTIGRAVMDLKRNPETWRDRGTHEEVLQELKLLWHVVVRYGKPIEE